MCTRFIFSPLSVPSVVARRDFGKPASTLISVKDKNIVHNNKLLGFLSTCLPPYFLPFFPVWCIPV